MKVQYCLDIIIFPEMNLTGYVSGPDIQSICAPVTEEITAKFKSLATSLNITILIGLAEKSDANTIFASHLIFSPSGEIKIYRKIHTAPYEKPFFSAGDKSDSLVRASQADRRFLQPYLFPYLDSGDG